MFIIFKNYIDLATLKRCLCEGDCVLERYLYEHWRDLLFYIRNGFFL